MRRRPTIIFAAALVVCALALTAGGCSFMKPKPAPAPARLGFTPAPGGVMSAVMPSSSGFVAVGWSSAQEATPRIWETNESGGWSGQNVGTTTGGLVAVAGAPTSDGSAGTRVAVGTAWSPTDGSATGAKVFAQQPGSAWVEVAVPNPAGKIDRLEEVMSLAKSPGDKAGFLAVGESADASSTSDAVVPIVLVSDESGTKWTAHDLPLPLGVSSASAFSVTRATPTSGWPGKLMVAGTGSGTDSEVGLVWTSADGVKWESVRDDSFEMLGQNLQPFAIRSAGDTVLMAGTNVAAGSDTADIQTATVWSAGPKRAWQLFSTSPSAESTRSSIVTAVGVTRNATGTANGYLIAEETFDTAEGFTAPGGKYQGNAALALMFSGDGQSFTDVTKWLPGLDQGALVTGLAQGSKSMALVGMKRDGTSGVWVVDAGKVK